MTAMEVIAPGNILNVTDAVLRLGVNGLSMEMIVLNFIKKSEMGGMSEFTMERLNQNAEGISMATKLDKKFADEGCQGRIGWLQPCHSIAWY